MAMVKPPRWRLYPFMFIISVFYPVLIFPFFVAMYKITKKYSIIHKEREIRLERINESQINSPK
jgi:hypothetical protein